MMGFSTLFIFALLQSSLLLSTVDSTGVNSTTEDLSNIHSNDSSNHHHRNARQPSSSASAVKKEDQSILDFNFNLEVVESQNPPEDAVLVSNGNEERYILLSGKCNEVKLEHKKSNAFPQGGNNEVHRFLVNKDNFEILEWKTWENIHNDQIPVFIVVICKKYYIARENGVPSLIKTNLKTTKSRQTELLTLNYDIKSQHLQIDNYEIKEENMVERLEVLKHFTANNRNCDPAKHVVKVDQGRDKSQTFLKSRTHTFGVVIEASVSGKIPTLVNVSGKIGVKYDQSRLNSETKSEVDKVLHSVSMEIQVPPNHSCIIEITSRTFMVQVPYSGQLIRKYRNNEERTTSINGMLDQQEIAELLTSVIPCTPLPDGTQC